MIYLARGLYKDVVILLVVSITLGAAFSVIGGAAVHKYFGNTVVNLIGDYGEHDLVLTINEGMQKQVEERLDELFAGDFNGAFYKESISIAGKTNIFVSLGANKTLQGYTAFLKELHGFPGLSAYNIMSEPRLSVRGIPLEAVPVIEDALAGREGIDFIMYTSRSLEIFLEDPAYLPALSTEVETLIDRYKILYLPVPASYDLAPWEMADFLQERLAADLDLSLTNVTGTQKANGSLEEDKLAQLEDLLAAYVPYIYLKGVNIAAGSSLYLTAGEGESAGSALPGETLPLLVYRADEKGTKALLLDGDIDSLPGLEVYAAGAGNTLGDYLGRGELRSPQIQLDQGQADIALLLPRLGGIIGQMEALQEQLALITEQGEVLTRLSRDFDKLQLPGGGNQLELMDSLLAVLDRWEDFWLDLDILKDASGRWQDRLKSLEKLLAARRLFLAPHSPLAERLTGLEEDILHLQSLLNDAEDALAVRMGGLDKVRRWREQLAGLEVLLQTGQEVDWPDYQWIEGAGDQFLAGDGHLATLEGDLLAVMDLLESLADFGQLPFLTTGADQVTEALLALQDLKMAQMPDGSEVMLMVPAEIDTGRVSRHVIDIIGPGAPRPQFRELGIFRPDIRGELFRVIGEVRLTLTALLAVGISLILLLLDHTVIMSLMQVFRRRRVIPFWLRPLAYEGFYGFWAGAFTLWGTITLAGGEIPYLDGRALFLIGGVLGLLVSALAQKLNPISISEFTAGEAMGMDLPDIVREIVLPAARPGVLSLLNRCNQLF